MEISEVNSIELIKNLSDAFAPSGFEDDIAEIAKSAIANWSTKRDYLKNLYIYKNTEKKMKIWLDAHADEVGFMVQAILPNGMLQFLPLGGWNNNTIPASKVKIRNNNGEYVSGVVASKPLHFTTISEKNKILDISEMVIDVGAVNSNETIEKFNIGLGNPIVPDVICKYDEKNKIFIGKAFDNRVGVAALLETLNQISSKDIYSGIIATISSQEEVGERGTMAAVQNINSDLAIIFEGCPADDTFSNEYMIQSGLKRGPNLRYMDYSMITNQGFMNYVIDIAKNENIPIQLSVRSGGGTNARYINASRYGVPTIVIAVPVRYVHSSYGIVALDDYLQTIKLAIKIIENLNENKLSTFK